VKEAVVAILRKADRVLVIERGPRAKWSGYWSPLSGRIEPGESQEEAVVREVREEIGLGVRPVLKVWECYTDDGEFLLHWWTVDIVEGHLTLEPGEASAARWVKTADFLRLEPTFAGDREFFERVLPSLL
jgi:8-oxo-dGTP pyrophosphatase MutT (NUDIX family)